MAKPQIAAFVGSVAHKFAVECGASLHIAKACAAITYPEDLVHPWPREFSYRIEFFVHNVAPEQAILCISSFLGCDRPEHVLNVFAEEEDNNVLEAYEQLGYRHAWTNALMNRGLSANELGREPEASVRRVAPEDIAAIVALAPDHPSSARAIKDPSLHGFVAEVEGKIVAKAQLVTNDSSIAYVSDMYTAPHHRQCGLASALLRRMHGQAVTSGALETILVPSLMTRQIGFYEQHGYRELIPMHLLIPDSPP
jgi:GNAT superfamily N-acetyltransferase